MQLTKLEIKGFKSFGDKVTVNFNEGVTAIVGPNGCGKSNVVDAMRWVLGEQSTKNLRSEKMENIIFNGTKDRKPANLAEVSLTFDNTKNILPTEFATVTITRKLFRNGDSEYRLNDVKCRLKDITDLFLDTGISSDNYAIIELKMIDELINNKDHSRRKLFEEASGISKYKVRKKQTLAKLRDTEGDLARVDDILAEITKNLKSLENQAKKAARYFELKQEYKDSSIALSYLKLAGFQNDLEAIEEQIDKYYTQGQQAINASQLQEAELEEKKAEILIKEKNLASQQQATQQLINQIRNHESEQKIKNTRLEHLHVQQERLNRELAQDKEQLVHLNYQIKKLNEEVYAQNQLVDSMALSTEQAKTALEELHRQQQAARAKRDESNRLQQELTLKIHSAEKQIAVMSTQKENLLDEIQRGGSELDVKISELAQFTEQIEELTGKFETLQQEFDFQKEQEESLLEQIKQAEGTLISLKEQQQNQHRLLDAKQNEYNLTKSMVDNLEGFPESIRFLKKHAGWTKTPALLSDILYCQPDYRIAIENYLEPLMNHYVVETQNEAIGAIRLLSDSAQGRAKFFILEALRSNTNKQPKASLAAHSELIPALDVIQVDARYQPLAEALLGHVFLSKDQDLTSSIEQELSHSATVEVILDAQGRFSRDRLTISGGSVGLFEGKRIGRAKNLEQLQKEIKEVQKNIDQLQTSINKQEEAIQQLRMSSKRELLEELKLQLNFKQSELNRVKLQHEQHQAFIQSSQQRQTSSKNKLQELENNLSTLIPQQEKMQVELSEQSKLQEELQEQYQQISQDYQEQSAAFNQENLLFHQQKNKAESTNRDLEYRESQQIQLEDRIEKHEKELASTQQQLLEASKPSGDQQDDLDLTALYAERDALEAGLKESEQDFYQARKTIDELELSWRGSLKQKEISDSLLSEYKDKKTALQIDLNALKERLSIEFSIDIQELLNQEAPEITESQTDLETRCKKLRKQLDDYGSINPTAKDAYQEIQERHGFIIKEKADLLHAKESLLHTISEIDQSANDKFMTAYNQVRENFVQVFRSLFNQEDACDLVLSDPENPLESEVEIIARPKGKRPLSINQLSGGEKTLTATALLFSLYLLKPAPFCIFDEVDAPLDDTNIDKFNNIIREFSKDSQFIIVSHNKRTIASTDIIYGVTMVEQGISRLVAVDLRDVA